MMNPVEDIRQKPKKQLRTVVAEHTLAEAQKRVVVAFVVAQS